MSCPRGQIEKSAYTVKGYTKSNGTHVKSFSVDPHCIKDMGKPGKGEKILPKLKGEIHLGNYGYTIKQSSEKRRKALRDAIKDNDPLEILRHLNLIRNYQADKSNKRRFSDDVDYLKDYYARWKNRNNKQKGGSMIVDEVHEHNGEKITFRTLNESDINDIKFIDNSYELNDNMIGVFINDEIQGVFEYKIDGDNVLIDKFKTRDNKNKLLYLFTEKFFVVNGYDEIYVFVDLTDNNARDNLNFFIHKGYLISEISQNHIILHKIIE